jgi:menaquinol-cytochrome c reductase iron-sulfur subunit
MLWSARMRDTAEKLTPPEGAAFDEGEPAADAPADAGRRTLLGRASAGLALIVAWALATPPLVALVGAWRRPSIRREETWVDVAGLDGLAAGRPVRATVHGTLRDGWMRHEGVPLGSVWLVRGEGVEVRALSNLCPHLGCGVDLIEGGRFLCPCHDSIFELDGTLVSGPARGGLPVVPARVEGGRVLVDATALEGEEPS